VILSPSFGLDGATGRPKWSIDIARSFLGSNDGKSLPRALTGPDGTTIRRVAMPATTDGTHSPAQGLPARPAVPGNDPRWERPLPWVGPIEPYAHPLVVLVMGARLTNICIPAAILWLPTRTRFWSMLLLELPVLVAILLTGYSAMSSLILDITVLSMSGLPIVVYAAVLVLSLVRRRWRKAGLFIAGALLAAILIGAITLLFDMLLVKTPIEHYTWSGWYQAVYLGVYAVGTLVLLAWPVRRAAGLVWRLARQRRAVISRSS
jgi:hypothetical protein